MGDDDESGEQDAFDPSLNGTDPDILEAIGMAEGLARLYVGQLCVSSGGGLDTTSAAGRATIFADE